MFTFSLSVGQILEEPLRRLRHAPLGGRRALLPRLRHPGELLRRGPKRQPLPGHRPRHRRHRHRHLQLLPGGEEQQDHGLLQEHDPPVRHCRSKWPEVHHSRGGGGGRRPDRGEGG